MLSRICVGMVIFCLFMRTASSETIQSTSHVEHYDSLSFMFGLVLNVYKFGGSSDTESVSDRPRVQEEDVFVNSDSLSSSPDLSAVSVADGAVQPTLIKHNRKPPTIPLACITDTVLQLNLENGWLSRPGGELASIDENHQFQFNDTVEKADNGVAGTWSVTEKGQLAYSNEDLFYQCHSGESYKLYDAPVHSRCSPIFLEIIELVACN